MRIAVDAMGGDRAPGEIVAGALAAVEQVGVEVLLVGIEDAVRAELPEARCRPESRSSAAARSSR